MIVATTPSHHTDEGRQHAGFLALLPRIETHARITFRGIRCPVRREETVAEAVGLAWVSSDNCFSHSCCRF